jgi:hypothetical protein
VEPLGLLSVLKTKAKGGMNTCSNVFSKKYLPLSNIPNMDVIAIAPTIGSRITVAAIRPTKVTDTTTKATITTKINIKAQANQKAVHPSKGGLLLF